MKITPIIFTAEMVRDLLDGRKTQTRRVIKGLPAETIGLTDYTHISGAWCIEGRVMDGNNIKCPYGQPGDLLWVRETFVIENTYEYHGDHKLPKDGRPIKEMKDELYPLGKTP